METLKNCLRNTRGVTLIELLVAVAIAAVVLGPIYELLLAGNTVQIKAFGQVELQEQGQEILNQLVAGKTEAGVKKPGLRQASQSRIAIEPSQGITFESAGKVITYYLKDQQIYYKEEVYINQPIQVSLTGGVPVLDNVVSFTPEETVSDNEKLYGITIQALQTLNSGGENEILVSTKVRPRNQ